MSDICDSRMDLESWLRWGRACPQELVGDFAFAVLEARQKRLFLAWDRIGMRPDYYTNTRRLFAFASQIVDISGDEHIRAPCLGQGKKHTFFRIAAIG